jgi:hypothetical protein
MSSNSPTNLIHEQTVFVCADCGCAASSAGVQTATELALLTRQTGRLLFTLGNLFTGVEPFNQVISHNTGELLISVGQKLIAA